MVATLSFQAKLRQITCQTAPTGHGLQPTSDGLQPASELGTRNLFDAGFGANDLLSTHPNASDLQFCGPF